jgi:cell division protein FtsN
VRVGSYPDRASVEEARRALKAKGYASFVAPRGEP